MPYLKDFTSLQDLKCDLSVLESDRNYLFIFEWLCRNETWRKEWRGTSFMIVKHIVSKIQWEVDFLVDQCSWKNEQRKKYVTIVLGVKFWSIKYKYKILK